MGPPPDPTRFGDTSKLQEGNDLVVKTYWPEEIVKEAKEYGD